MRFSHVGSSGRVLLGAVLSAGWLRAAWLPEAGSGAYVAELAVTRCKKVTDFHMNLGPLAMAAAIGGKMKPDESRLGDTHVFS